MTLYFTRNLFQLIYNSRLNDTISTFYVLGTIAFVCCLDAKASSIATGPANLDHQNLQDREPHKVELTDSRAVAAGPFDRQLDWANWGKFGKKMTSEKIFFTKMFLTT